MLTAYLNFENERTAQRAELICRAAAAAAEKNLNRVNSSAGSRSATPPTGRTYAHVCSLMQAPARARQRRRQVARMLTYAHVCAWQCRRQQRCTHFTYAHVCSRMLTYAPATAALHALHDSSYNAGSTLSAQRPLQLVDSGLFFFSDIKKKKSYCTTISAQRPLQLVDSVFFFTLCRWQREQQRRVGNCQGRGCSMRMRMSMRQQYQYAYAYE